MKTSNDWLKDRLKKLNHVDERPGEYVLYWMQSSQRAEYNQALEYSVQQANKRNQPLVVYFGLTRYPEANERHYRFMLEGLEETFERLWDRGVQIVLRLNDPPEGCIDLAGGASIVVLDRGYQRVQRQWYRSVIENLRKPVVQVETEAVVPVETASIKEEYMAVHLRRKISPMIEGYLADPPSGVVENTTRVDRESIDYKKLDDSLRSLVLERLGHARLRGGRSEAVKHFNSFLENKLDLYHEERNDPNKDIQSDMSPYLHFGQVSPIELAIRVYEKGGKGAEEYLEQLVVRRELAFNMVYYNPDYDNINCLPNWAKETLDRHASDKRPYTYSEEELEKSQTHDQYWNKAQREMVETGKMHGYMRMYWGKKILEWSPDPGKAYETALYLNNKYELDGRSCNGYTGIAWCFGKHDQAWRERPIFGKVRYMNDRGLERKFDMKRYIATGLNI